ncbi:hypothetical protein ABF215_11025 [Fusobacterium sp. THCT13E1]
MKYKLVVTHQEISNEKVFNNTKESEISIEETSDFIDIKLEEDKPEYSDDLIEQAYVDISNVFKEIKIEKSTNNIFNLKEIIKKWENVKKEIVFNTDDDMLVNFIINISKYYESEKSLEFLLKNFGIIPFFTLINFKELSLNNDKIRNLNIYNIIPTNPIVYKIKLTYNELINGDKEITFSGDTAPEFDMVESKKILKEEYEIPSDKTFTLSTTIAGKYIFRDDLENFEAVLKLEGGKYFKKEYIISLIKN